MSQMYSHQQSPQLVWDLLLSEVEPLDQHVVCKLLCCSKSMCDLVHSKCAGRLHVKMSGFGSITAPHGKHSKHTRSSTSSTHLADPAAPELTSWPQHHALGRWLAQHARLCSSIEVNITASTLPDPPSDDYKKGIFHLAGDNQSALAVLDASLAAGIQAAAGGPSSVPQLRLTRRQTAADVGLYSQDTAAAAAAAAASAAAAAATATAASSSSSGGEQPSLLLKAWSSKVPTNGRVLCALAGQIQLTSLQLYLADTTQKPAAGIRAALASLTNLQSLSLHTNPDTFLDSYEYMRPPPVFAAVVPALQQLMCLTKVSLNWTPDREVSLQLPPSLVSVRFGARNSLYETLGLQHLKNLTELHAEILHEEATLPHSLQQLSVRRVRYKSPLVQLQHLQHLQLLDLPPTPQLQQLQQLTGLTAFGMQCPAPDDDSTAVVVARLPLTRLGMHGYPGDNFSNAWVPRRWLRSSMLAALGSCTRLTYLSLERLSVAGTVCRLCEQLQKLPSLQELRLVVLCMRVTADSKCDGKWEPLWRAVPQLLPLRKLVAGGLCLEGDMVTVLAAATQLTCLMLADCAVNSKVERRLRSKFAHLLPDRLYVEHP